MSAPQSTFQNLRDRFRTLCESLALLLEHEGMAVRPYANENLIFFQMLSPESQDEAIELLEDYLATAKLVLKDKHSLKESRYFVQKALEYFELSAHPEFVAAAQDPRRISEFYSLKGTQFFRTFNYFEMTSYTLEDIYCRQWVDLYERPEGLTSQMLAGIAELVEKNSSQTLINIDTAHFIQERISLERLITNCQGLHITPLYQQGVLTGLACSIAYLPSM